MTYYDTNIILKMGTLKQDENNYFLIVFLQKHRNTLVYLKLI